MGINDNSSLNPFCSEVIRVRFHSRHALGMAAAAESHPQTVKRDEALLWESHCFEALAPVCELKHALSPL